MKLTPEIKKILENDGYTHLREVDGVICGLQRFMYTLGLMVNIHMEDIFGKEYSTYEYRFCYPYEKAEEAVLALSVYKYGEDPILGWIKQKGACIDRTNPILKESWIKDKEEWKKRANK